MVICIARQPIYDRNENIFGYEFLYRGNKNSTTAEINDDIATVEVLINTFLNFGWEELTNKKYSFINFTENLLLNDVPSHFPSNQLIIEVLEDIQPTDEIVIACKKYKELGFRIALDDFQLDEKNKDVFKLLPYIDIIKVDFRTTPRNIREKMLKLRNYFSIEFLAEKVETREEYRLAYEEKFDYFQGYFFNKPDILSKYDVPTIFHTCMRVIEEIEKPEPDIDKLSLIIESDLSLSYKLLKVINKHFSKSNQITSIRQAIVLLGLNEIKQWIYIIAVRESARNTSQMTYEIIEASLMRGKFCELFAAHIKNDKDSSSYFLTGMFSLIDTILHMEMQQIVNDLPLHIEIKMALLGTNNQYREALDCIIAIELADWEYITKNFQLSKTDVITIYLNSLKWAKEIVSLQNQLSQNSTQLD